MPDLDEKWLGRHGQQRLSVLHREQEVNSKAQICCVVLQFLPVSLLHKISPVGCSLFFFFFQNVSLHISQYRSVTDFVLTK